MPSSRPCRRAYRSGRIRPAGAVFAFAVLAFGLDAAGGATAQISLRESASETVRRCVRTLHSTVLVEKASPLSALHQANFKVLIDNTCPATIEVTIRAVFLDDNGISVQNDAYVRAELPSSTAREITGRSFLTDASTAARIRTARIEIR